MGGAPTWVWVDQARMTPAMARDFEAMAAEFRRVWGVDLLGTSGVRTDEEQERIFRERYTLTPNGRRVYDTRWWNGRLWYRISSAGTVAQPGTSNHQINLARGRRGAVDLRDGGRDPGVTRFGTKRNLWLRANAHRWGFNPDEGVAVGEAWHYRYVRDPWRAVLPTVTPGKPKPPAPKPVPPPDDIETPTLEELMAFKSVAVGYRPDPNQDRIVATALDWEDGQTSDAIVKKDYGISFYGALTEGGFKIITEGHYKDLLEEHKKATEAKREHELAVARASAGQ